MWQLLKALFLGGTTLLTPTPIEVGVEWITVTPSQPLSAITPGATLYFEVTAILPSSINATARLVQGEKIFPKGCAQAQLISSSEEVVSLSSTGVAASSTQTFLLLSATPGVPTDTEFSTIRLRADCGIKNTLVYWRNFTK